MRDPETVDSTNPEPAPDATTRLAAGAPTDPGSTQLLDLSKNMDAAHALKVSPLQDEPVSAQNPVAPLAGNPPIRVQKTNQPSRVAGQTQNLPSETRRPLRWKLPLALGALVVLGAAGYLAFSRGRTRQSPPPPVAAAPDAVPPGAQAYMEQAKAGDAHAMRMLGVMYYYGLNVPQDREKGLYWYRKAAEKGSAAAQAELAKLETAGK